MNKTLKITLISFASLLFLLLLCICIMLWLLLTPARLTPVVNNLAGHFITCQTNFQKVDVTFFSSFPRISLHVRGVSLVNDVDGAPSDTLLQVDDIEASVNLKKLLKEKVLEVKSINLKQGEANLYVSPEGFPNFDVFKIDTTEDTSQTFTFERVSAEKIALTNMNLIYKDEVSKIDTKISSLNAKVKACLTKENVFGKINLDANKIFFRNDTLTLFDSSEAKINLDASYDLVNNILHFKDVDISLDAVDLVLNGDVRTDTAFSFFDCELVYKLKSLKLKDVLPWAEKFSPGLFRGMEIKGDLAVDGQVKGLYQDSLFPLITADIFLKKGEFVDRELLIKPVKNIVLRANANLNLNEEEKSEVKLTNFFAETGNSEISLKGNVKDILNSMVCDIQLIGNISLQDLLDFVPEDTDIKMRGNVRPDVNAKFTLKDIVNIDLKKIKAHGSLRFGGLDVEYDSVGLKSDILDLNFRLSPNLKNENFKELLRADVKTDKLSVNVTDGPEVNAGNTDIQVELSDFMDTSKTTSLRCDFDFSSLIAKIDTVEAGISQPRGSLIMKPSKEDEHNLSLECEYEHSSIIAKLGSKIKANTKSVQISGDFTYDSLRQKVLDKWKPNLKVNIEDAGINMSILEDPIDIYSINFHFTPEEFNIKEGKFRIAKSVFNLSGKVKNIGNYMDSKDEMTGDLNFTSAYVDVNHIMDLVSGLNLSSDTVEMPESESETEDDPFMVPLGMNITLNTHADKLLVGQTIIDDLSGQLTVKDGTLIMEEMGFTCDAAKMQLTAMYKSPRKNHLFAYLDFHLLDIDIAELIDLLPDIDTIVPMLKTFSGKAEFHLAAQTNLKSNYDIKYSTLRGAMSISGKNLVILDNETFSTIAKYLLFEKKTQNIVDSLSLEMTVFQKEVDLYPFLISMDDYQAVVGGHYVIGENYDCDVSVVDCPLPLRLGLRIYGMPANIRYKLIPCKYPNLYKPERRDAVEKETVKLKQLISNSLRTNVKQ